MRGFGSHILGLCAFLEANGPSGSGGIAKALGISNRHSGVYCRRALQYGLVSVERPQKRSTKFYSVYTIEPDWKSKLKVKVVNEPAIIIEPIIKTGVNSVWELGHWASTSTSSRDT